MSGGASFSYRFHVRTDAGVHEVRGTTFAEFVRDQERIAQAISQSESPETEDRKLAAKRRFREAAKLHHPDRGGDPRKFMAAVEEYRRAMAQ